MKTTLISLLLTKIIKKKNILNKKINSKTNDN